MDKETSPNPQSDLQTFLKSGKWTGGKESVPAAEGKTAPADPADPADSAVAPPISLRGAICFSCIPNFDNIRPRVSKTILPPKTIYLKFLRLTI